MLLRKIERFLAKTGMSPTRFGRLATRDPGLVFGLRNGRAARSATERRVEHFMNTYQEQGHDD